MTGSLPSVMVDSRSSGFRRRVGPLAWVVLEEAALSCSSTGGRGTPLCSVSVRSVVVQLGVGKAAAARAIRSLVDTGVLVRLPPARGRGGRFDRTGYVLRLPEGISLSRLPVPGLPVSGERDTEPNLVTQTVSAGGQRATRADVRVGDGGQASLFDANPVAEASVVDATPAAPVVIFEPVGACLSDGYECEGGVHELAPGVRATRLSRSDPSEGGKLC